MEAHVVAVEARSPLASYAKSQASGLAIWTGAGAPLILTTCNIRPGSSISVALPLGANFEQIAVEARLKASTQIRQASEAFRSLESRGWRCGQIEGGFWLHVLRPAVGCRKPFAAGLRNCWSEPDQQWIGREIQLVFAPFGARSHPAGTKSLRAVVTRGRNPAFIPESND